MNEFSGTKRVGIIGAGIAGLAAAYDLTRQGCAVTIFEGAPVAGGLASGFKADTWQWPLERFYHHLFTSDSDIIRLTQEIGCQDLLIFRRPITSMWYQGKPYAFDSPLRLLAFPHLDWPNKFRMGFVFAYLRYVGKNWRAFEQTTSHAWLDRWMGPRGYNMLWRPMLEGKFGDHYQEVNLAWFWARIVKRSPRLGYFQGGFQAFVDALIARVTAQGAVVHLDSRVTNVRPAANRTLIVSHDRGEDTFDAVIATVSPSQMAALAPDLPAAYLGQLGQLKSMGAVVMTLALKHSLMHDTYWLNIPKAEGFPFLALVEHTNYIETTHYGGDHIIYLGDYLDPTHRYFSLSDQELLAVFLPALARINPDFRPDWVREAWVHKATYAQPVPPVNYSAMIPPLQTPIPGLFFASMSQVYPWDRGTNYAVEIGRRVAQQVQLSTQN
ncbi:MAG: NAD(P)/FAD-dependent oxidoreductase [Anaerolineae bacterium]|jgi:protoporphyrinogen oxidase|nr:NAD(P)/FAD-dependent oxidoreductase [Anaerolineae bacterium]